MKPPLAALLVWLAVACGGCAVGDLGAYDEAFGQQDAGNDRAVEGDDGRARPDTGGSLDAATPPPHMRGDAASPPSTMDGASDVTIDKLDAPDVVDAGVDARACNLASPFSAPVAVATLDNSMINSQAALSPDERTVYFASTRLGMGSQMVTASRADVDASFGAVVGLDSLNFTGADTWNATLTGDSSTAYFVTDQGGADHMYVATRGSALAPFGNIMMMPSPIVDGEQPYVLPNGQALYYSSTKPSGGVQIARATLGGAPVVTILPIVVVGATSVGIPVVDPTETILYFAAFDLSNVDSYDIWMSTRASDTSPWGTPSAVAELNTSGFDAPSWVSPDGCTIYLTHAATAAAPPEIYVATRP